MAWVERKRDRWRVVWRQAGERKATRTVASEADAKALLREVEHRLARGLPWDDGPAPPPLYDDVAVGWVTDARRMKLAASTIERRVLTHAQYGAWRQGNRAGRLRMDAVTASSLSDWYHALVDDGYARSTARQKCVDVRSLWSWAHDQDEWLGQIPAPKRLRLPPSPPDLEVFAPTWAQMDAVVRNADGWMRHLLLLLRYTQLRQQQAMHLRWSDIDLEGLLLTVRPGLPGSKSRREKRRGRVVPLHRELAADMAGWGTREGWVVDRRIGHASNRPCAPDRRSVPNPTIRAAWRAALTAEDYARLRQPSHAFRKGAYTQLLIAGHPAHLLDHLQGRGKVNVGGDTYTEWRLMEPALRPIVDAIPAVVWTEPLALRGGKVPTQCPPGAP